MPLFRSDDTNYNVINNGAATSAGFNIKGGEYMWIATGTFGGATLTLQINTPAGAWVSITSRGAVVQATSNAAVTPISLPAGTYRVDVTGGTPSALYAYLVGLG
jgi:hypothetical protein